MNNNDIVLQEKDLQGEHVNFVLPAIPLIWSAIKAIAGVVGVILFAKDVYKFVTETVPNLISKLNKYKKALQEAAPKQKEIDKKRERLIEQQKKYVQKMIPMLAELVHISEENPSLYKMDPQKKAFIVQLNDFFQGPAFKNLLENNELSELDAQKLQSLMSDFQNTGFIKEEHAEASADSSVLKSAAEMGLSFAGFELMLQSEKDAALLGGKLVSKAGETAIKKGAETAASKAMMGAGKTLAFAGKASAKLYSMAGFAITAVILDGLPWIANSALDSKFEKLSKDQLTYDKTMLELDQAENVITQQLSQYQAMIETDIKTLRDKAKESDLSPQKREMLEKRLTKLEKSLAEVQQTKNFSVASTAWEATKLVGNAAKTILSNKTVDAALVGMVAGMAIEKYRTKKEKEEAERLLMEQARLMKKFR
ncbi:MAG: hypothetical protein MJZ34_02800 [Paludibacteraceae bacterium]|nr:hypothetical protein [Paludibacteraceae bacterium]